MLSTYQATYHAVFSFDIVSVWKLTLTKLALSDKLTGPLRLISPVHWTTKLLFFLAPGNRTWVFSLSCSCPAWSELLREVDAHVVLVKHT